MTEEMSVSRLTRASGATAAAKAMAPQARTEKTVEKRILTEVGKGGWEVESWNCELEGDGKQRRRAEAEDYSETRSGFYTFSAPPRGRDTNLLVATCPREVCPWEVQKLPVPTSGRLRQTFRVCWHASERS